MRRFYLIFTLITMMTSCSTKSKFDQLTGSWEIQRPKTGDAELDAMAEEMKTSSYKTVITFQKDSVVKSENFLNGKKDSEDSGVFSLDNDGKEVTVYPEGRNGKKHVAKILQLDENVLKLVDVGSTGDSITLKRINK